MVFLFSCGDDEDVVGPVALAAPSIQISVSAGTSFNDATSLVADGVVIAGDSVFTQYPLQQLVDLTHLDFLVEQQVK